MLIKRDKWLQYRILRNGSSLAGRLPETQLLKKNALTKMLLQYQSVVLKPRDGSYGRDILFIKRNGANAYRIHNENNAVTMRDTDKLLRWLRKKNRGHRYIVQRRLQLAQIQHKPFDLRIMAQRKKGASSTWNVTGSYAKVAAQGYLVTNVTIRTIPVLEALKLARIGDRSLLVKAERIALLAAKRLGERYPKLRQVGFDIGIDRKRRIWIIEGNYQPALRPFRLLKDSSMHRRILWYKKH
ncbi:YheC/YheD family protein [Paenibacillus eucommiae]|uniref:Glutathione synthase/RimK-type ligase-like ATP-grasp enzyme n=1 Tax=Paenibacillus eucommiae TaxID=1355755 RepID=A0ABS4J5V1_9BACL|nr:YheC/YheD family protein [Paenibacillus eucommiae]MBP1994675.1 glutathione synthase/RimK-type ligase-like ATP-grasp enzyme [Paenibacillus eucommiae]